MRKNKSLVLLCACLVLFVALRAPGLPLPYHQDEWKNVVSVEGGAASAGTFLTHPPLTALLLRLDAFLFGGEHMRLLPFFFSIISFFLLFAVMRRRTSLRASIYAVFLYAVCFYGVWGSLMVDTDGAILPTFFLLSVYFYDRFREGGTWTWGLLLGASLLLGFLVKLSFILVLGALILDFLFENGKDRKRVHVVYALLALCGFGVVAVCAFFLAHILVPSFQIGGMIEHARSYVNFGQRNYTQILVQALKAVYYLSPLLLVPLFFTTRDIFHKTRVFWLYLACGFIFYFVLFDFAQGALDKYLLFTVVPLCAISGVVLAHLFREHPTPFAILAGVVGALAVFFLQFLPHAVVPLYPKTEWFGRVFHGDLAVLTPFTGGSGPLGFYISFLFISVSFLLSLCAFSLAVWNTRMRAGAMIFFLCLGISYSFVFSEELSFGHINGSAPLALASSLAYIDGHPSVREVMTYNDIGAYELYHRGLYAGRFYAAPQFENGHREKFSAYSGEYLVVGIPPLYAGFYSDFFAKCGSLFETHSGAITATLYSCAPTTP